MDARLGRAAREAREAAGLTLLDIATIAGKSQGTISRFERVPGWRWETDAIVDAYAKACGTTPEAIWRAALDLPD